MIKKLEQFVEAQRLLSKRIAEVKTIANEIGGNVAKAIYELADAVEDFAFDIANTEFESAE